MSGSLTVSAEKVWFGYKDNEWILKDVSLALREGSLNMVMGPSGSGKTSLLKVLAGLLLPQRGRVSVLGQPFSAKTSPSLRVQIGYIPQQLGLVRHLTVLENVLLGTLGRNKTFSVLMGFFPKKDSEEARALLEELGIGDKAEKKVMQLSGGERQRVAIARTLIQKPKVIFADEFISDVDFGTAREILGLVQKISRNNKITFLMSMHELELVKDLDSAVFLMNGGKIQHECPASELDSPDLERFAAYE